MKAKESYQVGIYLRLSRDDTVSGGIKPESDSISSQRELCRAFVRGQRGMEIYDIYTDDGYSGSNFERPAFKRMMEDVRAGRVDCIVVKDLSRFGREYIEAGRLIQKTFPALNVRFIALTDRFDSLTADYNETALVLPVKNFVNDAYCRDISDKVKSHQRIKRENGEFIGAFAVYGYRKDPANRNRLVPDDYAAEVVRRIFGWRLGGVSATAIAKKLNALGILSPLEYKRARGESYACGFAAGLQAKWSAVAVKRILTNAVYTGVLEQGKTEKVSVKVNRYCLKPREEWARVEHTHEPIVSRDEFEGVQRLMETGCRCAGGRECAHMFSGLLFCGDCGAPMARRVSRYKGREKLSFICSAQNKGRGCTRHNISEKELSEAVHGCLRLQAAVLTDREKTEAHIKGMEVKFEEIGRLEREMERLAGLQEQYLSLQSGLHEDLQKGVITRQDFYAFGRIYEEKYIQVKRALAGQEELIRGCLRSGAAAGRELERFKETQDLAELDRNMLVTFVRRIDLYEGRRIHVEFNIKGLKHG